MKDGTSIQMWTPSGVQIFADIIYRSSRKERGDGDKSDSEASSGGEWRVLFVTIACIIGSNVVAALCATAEPKKRKDLFLE